MSSTDVVVKVLPGVHVAELTAGAAGFRPEDITPAISLLFERLCGILDAAGVPPVGHGLAYDEDAGEGESVVCHAAMPVASDVRCVEGLTVVDLPPVDRAATVVHHGSMQRIMPTAQALARWIDTSGHRCAGYAREVCLECTGGVDTWVTEIQEPLAAV